MTYRCNAMAVTVVLALTGRAVADDIYWVGYQNECMVDRPDNSSFNHGDNWLNYLVPEEFDRAIFGAEENPDGNPGWPHVVHFGDFCVDVFDCPNPFTVLADDVLIQFLEIQDDWFTFDMGSGRTPLRRMPQGSDRQRQSHGDERHDGGDDG